MKKGEDGSHLAQVCNQLAIRDWSDGDILDVVQVAAEVDISRGASPLEVSR